VLSDAEKIDAIPLWMKLPMTIRPGKGWIALGSGVYEHTSKIRIHVGGLVRLQDGTFLRLNHFDEGKVGHDLIRINGGNVKRSLMAWAANFATTHFGPGQDRRAGWYQ
jgi:hypothetical protein